MNAVDFVRESNRIEGILRDPTAEEVAEFERFVALHSVWVDDLRNFVSVYQPDAVLRDRVGLNVRVGNHIPPAGGPQVALAFVDLLKVANNNRGKMNVDLLAFDVHMNYETLHPFTDGNGRSGRALWAWCMGRERALSLGFLHRWYYQSLDRGRA